MKNTLTNEQRALLKIISKTVFSGEGDIGNTVFDAGKMLEEAGHQAVIPIAFEGCIDNNIDLNGSAYMEYFKKTAKISAKNENLLHVQDICVKAFKDEGIPFAVIKGAAVSCMYPDPEIRSMGDVDILVDKGCFERSKEILIKNGFVYKGGEGDIHREFTMNGCVLELHFEVNGIPKGEKGEIIRDFISNGVFDTEECSFGEHTFPVPMPHIHGVILLLHLYQHFQTGGVGLRHICDWGAFSLKYLNNSEKCYEILDKFKELSVYEFSRIMTCAARECFDIPFEFEWLSEDDRSNSGTIDSQLVCELIYDVFEGGNFGYKNPEERYMSDILVKREGQEQKGAVSRGISNFKSRINTSMPSTKKHPALIAVAPVYIPVRYIYRVATGKRKKVNPIKMVQKSSKRRALYDQFEMFK